MSNEIKCITCGNDCVEPFIFQSSDIFSQSWLRVCNIECFYGLTSEFLYSIYEHKNFYTWLGDKENKTDKEARNKRTKEITDEALKEMKKSFKRNKNLLSTPIRKLKTPVCKESPPMKFRKYHISLESKIKGAKERISTLEKQLSDSRKALNIYLKDGKELKTKCACGKKVVFIAESWMGNVECCEECVKGNVFKNKENA